MHTDCTQYANSLALFHSSLSALLPLVLLVLSVWSGEEEGKEEGRAEGWREGTEGREGKKNRGRKGGNERKEEERGSEGEERGTKKRQLHLQYM